MRVLYFVDIDGTIADHTQRALNAGTCPSRSQQDAYKLWVETINTGMEHDSPIAGMKEFALLLHQSGCLFYLTNRGEQHRRSTESWLYKHGFPAAPVIMRSPTSWDVSDGDYKQGEIYRILDKLPFEYSIVMVDDDPRGEIHKMCVDNKWTFLKAAFGIGKN